MRIKMGHEEIPHTAGAFTKNDRGRVFNKDLWLAVRLHFIGPNARNADGDNMEKGVFDAITKAGVWWDDKQVDSCHWTRKVQPTSETRIVIFEWEGD